MIAVMIGAFLGAIARFELSRLINHKKKRNFPYGTFVVNLLGCFLIGVMFQLELSHTWVLICITGFLGAFTTFSTFSVETIELMYAKQFKAVALYIGCTVFIGLFLTWVGFHI